MKSLRRVCIALLALVGSGATFGQPPLVSTAPVSAAVMLGQPAAFVVKVTGANPLSYQWRKNGVAIPGATGSTINFAQVQTADAAAYDVVVRNAQGTVTSAAARLTLIAPQGAQPAPPSGVGRSVMEGVVHGVFDSRSGERVGRVRIDYVRVEPQRHGFLHVAWRPQVLLEGVTLELSPGAKWPEVGAQIRAALSGGRPGEMAMRRVRLLLPDGREVVAPAGVLRGDGALDLDEALVATNGLVANEPVPLQFRLTAPRAGELVAAPRADSGTRRRPASHVGPVASKEAR